MAPIIGLSLRTISAHYLCGLPQRFISGGITVYFKGIRGCFEGQLLLLLQLLPI